MRGAVALSPGDHVVHVYQDDADLAGTVVAELAPALAAGEPIIVIAVGDHRRSFGEALAARGMAMDAAEAAGLLVWRDAEQVAAALLSDGGIDRPGFEASIAALVRRVAADHAALHVYGEIVGVLWRLGEVVAAIELEQLWTGLMADVPTMSLLCGYAADVVAGPDSVDGYVEICASHHHVIGAAPTPTEAEATRRFPSTATAVRHARRFVADTLRDWGRADALDVALLVVSELATNAVRHARSEFTISLTRTPDGVRVAVGDAVVSEPPEPRTATLHEPHGRGLLLVRELSARWGHELLPDGKLVWAEVGEPAAARGSAQ
jgi:anti-sigma regulatory factor (Ser/Thr protein kinase)